jgi:hypothetical protein
MMDLPVTVAILFEHFMKQFKFSQEILLIADGSSSMYQGQ